MPYINKETRASLDTAISGVCGQLLARAFAAGDSNYVITSLIARDLNWNGENYERFNKWVGVLECVKLELYRRKAALYEDRKCTENGDVY